MEPRSHQKSRQSDHPPVHDALMSRPSRNRPLRPVPSPPHRGPRRAEVDTKPTRRNPKCVPLACDNCRLRKAKCSGSQPCVRCHGAQVDCVFTGRALDQLRRKVKELEAGTMVLANIFDKLRASDAPSIEAIQQLAAKSATLQEFVHGVSQDCGMVGQDLSTSAKQSLLAEANLYPSKAASSPFLHNSRTDIASLDNESKSSTDVARGAIAVEYKACWQGPKKDSLAPKPLQNGQPPTKRPRVFTEWPEVESPDSDPLNEPDFEAAPLPSPISITSSCFPSYVQDPQLPTLGHAVHLQPIRLTVADNNSTNRSQVFGRAQRQFAAKGRQLIMQLSPEIVLGSSTLDVPGLLQPPDVAISDATDVHTFSKVYMFQFHNVKTAERIALTYLLMLFMRWLVLPCQGTYDDMPWWLRPAAADDVATHLSGGYVAPWSAFDESVIDQPSRLIFTFAATTSVNWPFPDSEIIWFDENTGTDIISPVFLSHLFELNNWTHDIS